MIQTSYFGNDGMTFFLASFCWLVSCTLCVLFLRRNGGGGGVSLEFTGYWMDSETRQHQNHHYHVFLFYETLKRFLNVLDFRSQSEITPPHWKTLWQFFKNKHNNKNTPQRNRYLVTQQFHPKVCTPESWRRVCAHKRWTAVFVAAVCTRS